MIAGYSIVSGMLVSRCGDMLNYSIPDRLKWSDKLVIIMDNEDDDTRNTVMKFKFKYPDEIDILTSGVRRELNDDRIFARFNDNQGIIRETFFKYLRCLEEAYDIIIYADSDEIFSDYFPKLIEDFMLSDKTHIGMRSVDVYGDFMTITDQYQGHHTRVMKWNKDLSSIPYRGFAFYNPLKRANGYESSYCLIHLAALDLTYLKWKNSFWRSVRTNWKCWKTPVDVRKMKPSDIKLVYNLTPNSELEGDGAVLCSYRFPGGGNQSGKRVSELLGYTFWRLDQYVWKDCKAKKQIWYMNDDIYRLRGALLKDFEKVLSYAEDIKIVYNYVVGGSHKDDWLLQYPVSKVVFQSKTKLTEWEKAVRGLEQANIPTSIIPPPIDISRFFKMPKNRYSYPKYRIGRHSRVNQKYPDNPIKIYEGLVDREDFEFHFMEAHPKIKDRFKNNSNFCFYEWNGKPIEDFLFNIDIWLTILDPGWREQGARALCEAMAAGCCVIVEERDGMLDKVIHGETGFLVKSEDEAIEIAKSLTIDWIVDVGEKARKYAFENFGPNRWIKEMV